MYNFNIMKKIFLFLPILALTISCKKQPSACIDGPLTVELGESATYTSCSEHEGEIQWRFGSERSSEKSFTPTFNSRGAYTIELNIKNGNKQDTKSIRVEYGKSPRTICTVLDVCSSNIPNHEDVKNYKAYLYDSKADWVNDVKNKSHSLVIDSTSCEYSAAGATGLALFQKTFVSGTTKIVSIEYRNPSNSSSDVTNWGSLISDLDGKLTISNGDYADNSAGTRISKYAKKLLSGKWFLSSAIINNNPVTPAPCTNDDFLKFFGDGTWVYDVGNDNCSNTSLPSNGTFTGFTSACDSPVNFGMYTLSGSFIVNSPMYDGLNTIVVSFNTGASSGSYTFTYQP
jgi:hypothetical protein